MISSIIPVSFVGSKWAGLSAAKLPWGCGFKERTMEGTEIRSKKYFRPGIADFFCYLFGCRRTFWLALDYNWMVFPESIPWSWCISNAKAEKS
jgi:hypothetical protein